LDHHERNTLMRHLDRVGMPELVVAPLPVLPTPDKHGAAGSVQIALLERRASLIRRPARQSSTISARSRWPSARSPMVRITAMISSTVGGSAGVLLALVAW